MGILGTSLSVVGSIWGVGSGIYKEVSHEISKEIDEETQIRVRKILDNDTLSTSSSEFKQAFDIERLKVKKDAKEIAGKGALMIFGFGLLF